MGSETSKEESRSNAEQSRQRSQYATQQRRAPTTVNNATYQSPSQAPATRPRTTNQPDVLERSRAPYNCKSEDLQQNQVKKAANLYPNLNMTQGDDSYVYVNNSPQRSRPQPSAPPASEVIASAYMTPRPTSESNLPRAATVQSRRESQTSTCPEVPQRPSTARVTDSTTQKPFAVTFPTVPPTSRLLSSDVVASTKSPAPTFSASSVLRPTPPSLLRPSDATFPQCPPTPTTRVENVSLVQKASAAISPMISSTYKLPSPDVNAEASKQPRQGPLSPHAPEPSISANSSANKKKNRPKPATSRDRTWTNSASEDKLKCPTCGQRLGLTIFQCSEGHSSCKDCHATPRKLCGYRNCVSPITDMRNILLESYIAELDTKCENHGCTLSFKPYEMDLHLKECPFGVMDCPMGTVFGHCSTRCKVADMATHFDTAHQEQRTAEIDKEMFLFNICMQTHKLFLIKNGPFNFLVHIKVGEQDRKISMAVQLLGTKNSAEKWTYEFHVYNKRQPLRKFFYADTCTSISTPVADTFKGNQCATLPLNYAMTFVNESTLNYKFYIKKVMNQRARRGPRNNNAN